MASNRSLYVTIIGDDASLQKAFKRSAKSTQDFERNTKQTFRGVLAGSGAFRALGRQVAFASGAFLGAAGLTAVLTKSVNVASNLAEQTNKVNVVFGKSAPIITNWAKTTANGIGIANDQALEAAGTFGNLFTTVGLLPKQNAELSVSLVKLSADLASFNNASPEDTLLALKSGLVGEAEPLRKYGILLTEARVQQEAMRESGKKSATQLTQQEKLLARYSLIVRDSSKASGDFSRTSDGQANAQRRLSAEIRDSEAAIGQALLPAINDVTKRLADWLGKTENQKKIQEGANKTVQKTGGFLHNLRTSIHNVHGNLQPLISGFQAFNDAMDKAGKTSVRVAQQVGSFFKNRIFEGPGFVNVADRAPGLSPGGPASAGIGALRRRTGGGGGGGGAGGGAASGPLGFNVRFARLELARFKAELTQSQKDDRAVLVAEQALIRQRIGRVKTLKERRALYQDLATITGQIWSIDERAASAASDAAEKHKAKLQAAREKELAQQKKAREAIQAQSDKVNREFAKMLAAQKAAAQRLREKLSQATDAVRSQIGALFSGPVLNPTESATKGILGVTGGPSGPTIGKLTQDVIAQTAGFVRRNNDLARLARAGAPGSLLKQLREGGDAGIIHTLATSSKAAQARLFKAVTAQDKVIQQIAHADIQARTVIVTGGNVRHSAVTPASQRRGRGAGIVQGGFLRGD